MRVTTILSWILAIFVAFIFVQSLFFKFTDAPESIFIFSQIDITVEQWVGTAFFEPTMRYVVGGAEALAALLILLPFTRFFGALLSLAIISGAIVLHLTTELGTVVQFPEDLGGPDPTLFYMAVAVCVASFLLLFLSRSRSS